MWLAGIALMGLCMLALHWFWQLLQPVARVTAYRLGGCLKSLDRPQTEISIGGKTGLINFISLSRDPQERALTTLVKAEETEELNVALRAIKEARGNWSCWRNY